VGLLNDSLHNGSFLGAPSLPGRVFLDRLTFGSKRSPEKQITCRGGKICGIFAIKFRVSMQVFIEEVVKTRR
jgi:hypothetical protein